MISQKISKKSIDKYVYVWYTIVVRKRYFTCFIRRFSKCCFVILLVVLLSSIFTLLLALISLKIGLMLVRSRDADGAYLVDSIDYIIDYVNDAINGCNPDMEGKLDADLL